MSILIKGMEMPKNCYQCRMVDSCQYLWKPYGLDDYSDLQDMIEEGFTRADNCPLVEVPPHGDLIDRDAMIRDIQKSFAPSWYIKERNADMVKFLSLEDTIIPAEESET